jgi:membrane protein YdbS with pleckstrin-like domain
MSEAAVTINDETGNVIFNLNRLPFRDFDSAARMRDLLHRESGHHYQVEQYQDDGSGGFVVIRSNQNGARVDELNDGANVELNKQHDKTSSQNTEQSTQIYHPALRTYLLYLPILFAGAILLFFPQELWLLVVSFIDSRALQNMADIELLIKITKALGAVTLLVNGSKVLYSHFAKSLIVDDKGVSLKQGIIAQDIINIRFSEIKTVGLKRGIFERLINIGTLEFASAGSDGVDIRFINLASPVWLKQDIENRIENAIQASKKT